MAKDRSFLDMPMKQMLSPATAAANAMKANVNGNDAGKTAWIAATMVMEIMATEMTGRTTS